MFIYNYDEKIACLNKSLSRSKIIDMVVIIVFLLSLIAGTIIVFILPFDTLWNFCIVSLCGFFINFALLSWSTSHEEKYEKTKYTAFVEENGILYKVFAIGKNEDCRMQSIKSVNFIIEALQEYKMGNSTTVIENGCALQIHEIKKIEDIKDNKKYWECVYFDELNQKHFAQIGKVFNNGFELKKFIKNI